VVDGTLDDELNHWRTRIGPGYSDRSGRSTMVCSVLGGAWGLERSEDYEGWLLVYGSDDFSVKR
jgi:hypothetical protein